MKYDDDLTRVIERLERLENILEAQQFRAVDHLPEPHQASYEEILGHYRRRNQAEAADFARAALARRKELLSQKKTRKP